MYIWHLSRIIIVNFEFLQRKANEELQKQLEHHKDELEVLKVTTFDKTWIIQFTFLYNKGKQNIRQVRCFKWNHQQNALFNKSCLVLIFLMTAL